MAAVAAGIKKANRRDLVLVELAPGSHCAAVFTRNRFSAAPVQVARRHLATAVPRYLLINTGYANAGTGAEGERRCLASCQLLAEQSHCDLEQVLPFSTGVIGELFSLAPFERGIPQALATLDSHAWGQAAEGIMTTDTRCKLASRRIELDGVPVSITGMAKGSGMIKPNMATLLAFVATDASIAPALLQRWLGRLAEHSFNRISVDGDTSTNDACLLIATGQAGMAAPLTESDEQGGQAATLYQALEELFVDLAQQTVRDGEGASKFVTVRVTGADSADDARVVAETVAHSPLVKTALFASDPNWGRILAAVGRAPIAALAVDRVAIWLGEVQIVEAGAVAADYREQAGAAVMAEQDICITIDLAAGTAESTIWTCDFSYDYVRINAEYRS